MGEPGAPCRTLRPNPRHATKHTALEQIYGFHWVTCETGEIEKLALSRENGTVKSNIQNDSPRVKVLFCTCEDAMKAYEALHGEDFFAVDGVIKCQLKAVQGFKKNPQKTNADEAEEPRDEDDEDDDDDDEEKKEEKDRVKDNFKGTREGKSQGKGQPSKAATRDEAQKGSRPTSIVGANFGKGQDKGQRSKAASRDEAQKGSLPKPNVGADFKNDFVIVVLIHGVWIALVFV